MARRNLLHRSKLDDFKAWLIRSYGDVEMPVKGGFEVLRFRSPSGGSMPIIFNGSSPAHFSCNEAAVPYVKQFIKGRIV